MRPLTDSRGSHMLCSESQAASWFRLAAANGSMAAASNLGICYEDGVGASVLACVCLAYA